MLIEKMATELGIPVRFVQKLANSASHEYKSYNIPKRSGGFREIHHPSRQLKGLQRWLLTNVIDKFPVHEAATAYRKGGSIFKNAATHATSRYLLRMDFENFFPSIKSADLRAYLHRCAEHQLVELDGWTSNDTDLFCQIVLRHSALTIGAPTSPRM